MERITLKVLCDAIMEQSTLFRGSRDDWGKHTENLYEALENMSSLSPNQIIKIDSKKTRVKPRKKTRLS